MIINKMGEARMIGWNIVLLTPTQIDYLHLNQVMQRFGIRIALQRN